MGYDIVLNVLNLYRDFSLSLDLQYVFAQDVFIVHKFFVTAIWKEKEKLKHCFSKTSMLAHRPFVNGLFNYIKLGATK